jgi:hypothetical protein
MHIADVSWGCDAAASNERVMVVTLLFFSGLAEQMMMKRA